MRARPELDGRLLQPSNQQASDPDLVDVFPQSDRIVDLASVELARSSDASSPVFIEISHPWPPNQANALEPGTWRLELLVRGDNIKPKRSFATVSFDEILSEEASADIWEHLTVLGPSSEISRPPAASDRTP